MEKLKIGIVGFGFMGKTHALNIMNSTSMELVAIVDKVGDKVKDQLNEAVGNFDTGNIDPEAMRAVHVYKELDACLANEKLDALLVCVHTRSHAQLTRIALENKLHVFVEKPFVLDVAEGESLITLAQKQNRVLMVGHVVRFMPAYVKLREIVNDQRYGKLKFISLSRFTGVPNWGEWKNRQTDFGSSGGALFDLVIHDIDYLQHVLGMPTNTKCTYSGGALSNHDYICAFWQYEGIDSLQVKVEGGDTFHSNFPFEASFKAQFEDASLVWNSSNGGEITIANNDSLSTIEVGNANDGFCAELEHFAACIQGNETMMSSAASALDSIRLCYRMIE